MKRKKRHVRYVERYLYDLKYDILNKALVASKEDFKNKRVNKSMIMNEWEKDRLIKIIVWCIIASITIIIWHQVWKLVAGT